MIEKIQFKFRYIPWNKNYPISEAQLTIIAKTRKEAELIALENGWKFFNQDCSCIVEEQCNVYETED